MRSRLADPRALALVAAVVAALVGLAVLGRWEKHRWVQSVVRGQGRIVRLVGPLEQRSLVGFRVLPQFDCLVYRRGAELLALELCVDGKGKLIEAIDRVGGARRYYDLESDPGAATIRLDRAEVDRLLRKMGAE
jgi:hypothetical protein